MMSFHFTFSILPSFMPYPRFHPFARLILCAVAVLVSVLALSTPVFVLMGLNQAISTGGAPTSGFSLPPRALVALMAAQIPAMIGAVWLCRRILDARSLVSLGVRGRNMGQFFSGALCGLLAITFLFGLLWVSGHVQIVGLSERAREAGTGGILSHLLLWAVLMIGVGLAEEILFRGYALHNLGVWLGADKIGLGAAAIIQAILFGLVHLGNFQDAPTPERIGAAWQALPNIVLIGVFFALCAFKTGSLWFPIGFHAAWNFFLGSVFSLPVSGLKTFHLLEIEVSSSRWLTGGAFGAEGSILLTIIILVLIYLIRQTPDHPQFIGDIASLRPQEEPDEVEVGSRAPSLRERKEKRREQVVTGSTFEGWNDLAPAQRQQYSTYQPSQPALPTTTPTENFAPDLIAQNSFATNAPLENPPVNATPPVSTPVVPDFAELVPPLPTDPQPEPQPAPPAVSTPVNIPVAAPEPEKSVEKSLAPSTVPSAPAPSQAPPASPTPTPPTPAVKKPPAPRW
ncbi:MAG TPA: type II CAAX endopeptidase family protein [Abditibacteriaceae bacterium]|jgi:hypothetical protein